MDEQDMVMEHPLFRLLPDAARADLVIWVEQPLSSRYCLTVFDNSVLTGTI